MLEPAEIDRWRRLTDAMLDHAAKDDPEAFAQVVELLDRANGMLPGVAGLLRDAWDGERCHALEGYSWAELARPLGITRQACAQRFGRAR